MRPCAERGRAADLAGEPAIHSALELDRDQIGYAEGLAIGRVTNSLVAVMMTTCSPASAVTLHEFERLRLQVGTDHPAMNARAPGGPGRLLTAHGVDRETHVFARRAPAW